MNKRLDPSRCAICGTPLSDEEMAKWKALEDDIQTCLTGRACPRCDKERTETEAVDCAQQFFEAAVYHFKGTLTERAVWVTAMLERWPWLRPNAYQVLND